MKKLKLKLIKEDTQRNIYVIDQEYVMISDKKFKIDKSTSVLSTYLNKNNSNLILYLNSNINNNCIHCGKEIDFNRFERNKFITYKYCKDCNNTKTTIMYKKIYCIVCGKEILNKDKIFSTCGDEDCINEHKKNVYQKITDTHWSKTIDKEKILNKISETRLKNDKKLNRVYVAWNKGKTGIYSLETIEKIRNATINQMKNGKIKKSGQEKIFEQFLKDHDIKYKYSVIYKKRQYDFLLIDYNLIIELQGDYWHGNPMFWDIYENDNNKKKLYETQKMKIKDDIIKKKLIDDSKYNFCEFWEYDIYNNFDNIVKTLTEKYNIKIYKK